jgi:hypothetical protein
MHLKKDWPQNYWRVSTTMLNLTVKTILKDVKVNRNYDIPYLAGYSNDGKTIFIDRHMPKSFVYRGRRIMTDRFLILHEAIEKALIDKFDMIYEFAHQIALRSEEAAVRAQKISWDAYNKFMNQHIKSVSDERIKKVPKKLDLKPYIDEEDRALLKQMKKVMC